MSDYFVTNDRRVIRPGPEGRDPDDDAILRAGNLVPVTPETAFTQAITDRDPAARPLPPGFELLTDAEIRRLGRRSPEAMGSYALAAELIIDGEETARVVRAWRVERGLTWRQIAREMHMLLDAPWRPPSNQLAGQALCARAAEVLGEDYHTGAWNEDEPPVSLGS